MKNTKRTVREWLNMLPEPYRTEAFKNGIKQPNKVVKLKNLFDASNSFLWHSSPQRTPFWEKLEREISNGTITLTEPEKEFVWDDETVLEFNVSNYSTIRPLREGLEQFKASKQRKPFITEDGKNLNEGEDLFFVRCKLCDTSCEPLFIYGKTGSCWTIETLSTDNYKYFSTEQAAKDYIELNEKRYSIKDIETAYWSTSYWDEFLTALKNKKG